jgi:hypothetical protein
MASRLIVQFCEHVSPDEQRLVLSFLNAVSGQTEATGATEYTFLVTRPSRVTRAREGLLGWEKDGLIRWNETSA